MADEITVERVTAQLLDALDRAAIDYVVVGSLASSFYGVARSTQDASRATVSKPPTWSENLVLDMRDPQMAFETVTSTNRAEHGEYPEQLQALVPSILPAQPIDLFHANPFVYRRDDNGYLLYCLGEDGIADGGSNHSQSMLAGRKLDDLPPDERPDFLDKIPAEADDISIRLPRPTFSLPTPSESP